MGWLNTDRQWRNRRMKVVRWSERALLERADLMLDLAVQRLGDENAGAVARHLVGAAERADLIPAGATPTAIYYQDAFMALCLVVTHESFDEVPDYHELPVVEAR